MKQHIKIPTVHGDAEATKEGSGEPWEINYPWGSERFYGSLPEAQLRMARAAANAEIADREDKE